MSATRSGEKVIAGAGLFLSTAALFPLLRPGEDPLSYGDNGDPLVRVLWVGIYAVVVVVLMLRFGETIKVLGRQKLVLALVGLTIASVLWSEASGLTFQRSIALALTTAFAFYAAIRFRPEDLLDLVAGTLGVVAVVSLALIVLDPSLGLDHARGEAWRGAFSTKNELGRIMTLAGLVWFSRIFTRRGRTWVSLAFLGLSLALVAGSGSRGSIVALALLGVFVLAVRLARAHESVALPGFAFLLFGCAGVAFWILTNTGSVLRIAGADPTLTGRTELWGVAWEMARERPWLGYGYDAFWRGVEGPSQHVWAVVGWTAPHAHNGFLDLWLAVGFVGLALFALSFLGNARTAVAQLRRRRSPCVVFGALFLGYLLAFNVAESGLVTRNSIFWILYVAVSVQLARAHADAAAEGRKSLSISAVPVGARP